ncbi:MAG TPA: hypothetical protein PK098_05155 [Phycisphaerales bacterium]|nr:hypothetical protein [Phycisphaerales bacterium]
MRVRLVVCAALLPMLVGCASPAPTAPEAARPDPEAVRSALVRDEIGLEVRQWLVIDGVDVVPTVLTRHRNDQTGASDVLTHDAAERLRRNGLRLVRVPVTSLEQIAEEFHGLALDRTGWHGQVVRWQELHAAPVGPAPRAVAIDGRVRRFDRGTFQLMSRSWLVRMETGPFLQLELLPQFRSPEDSYRKVLGQPSSSVIAWPSMAVDVLMEHGHAYILLSESPVFDWSDATATSTDTEPAETRPAGTTVGPEAIAGTPTTIGELMLSSEGPRRARGMLVFVPRIPADLLPPETELPQPDAEDFSRSARR